MSKFVSNKNESVRLFKNPILEALSHIHPATPFVFFVPVILYFAYLSVTQSSYLAPGLWATGLLIWTFIEYTIHRFAFHIQPKSKLGKRFYFLVHGVHHDYPRDATRLVMPLPVSIPLASAFYGLFYVLFAPYHDGIFTGMISGYLAYDFLHFAFHHFSFKAKWFTWLKVYHLKHHYNDPDSGYGVSNPLWDVIFRTLPEKKKVTRQDLDKWNSDELKAA